MPIIVNTRTLNGPITGVQRYTDELVTRLPHLKNVGEASSLGVKGHMWEQFTLPKLLHGDLLWSPANTGPLSVRHQIITIHDVATLDHPEWFDRKFATWYRFMIPRLVKNCAKVITVSEFSKQRIADLCGIPKNKIMVTPLGVDEKFRDPCDDFQDIIMRLGLSDKRYLLFVSSLEPRKNAKSILEAWSLWEGRPADLILAVVGSKSNIFSEQNLSATLGDVHFLGRLSDEDLRCVYQNAYAFVYASLYEGFGLPVLEAMAAGCPVISSNRTSLSEVIGDAALLIDPTKSEDILEKMKLIVGDTAMHNDLKALAINQSLKFNWDNTAKMTNEILESVSNVR